MFLRGRIHLLLTCHCPKGIPLSVMSLPPSLSGRFITDSEAHCHHPRSLYYLEGPTLLHKRFSGGYLPWGACGQGTAVVKRELPPAWLCTCSVPCPEVCLEPSFCLEREESRKMHTLPKCSGELVFKQENHSYPMWINFSFCVCMHVITFGKHTNSHGLALSGAVLKNQAGKFEIVWRLFRASHYLICAFNDYCGRSFWGLDATGSSWREEQQGTVTALIAWGILCGQNKQSCVGWVICSFILGRQEFGKTSGTLRVETSLKNGAFMILSHWWAFENYVVSEVLSRSSWLIKVFKAENPLYTAGVEPKWVRGQRRLRSWQGFSCVVMICLKGNEIRIGFSCMCHKPSPNWAEREVYTSEQRGLEVFTCICFYHNKIWKHELRAAYNSCPTPVHFLLSEAIGCSKVKKLNHKNWVQFLMN